MSEKGHDEHKEVQKNESTETSNNWLKGKLSKAQRWFGHGVRWYGTELAIGTGSKTITLGTIASILTSNPIPLAVAAAVGGAISAGGYLIQRDAMDQSEYGPGKKLFKLLKFGQTAVAPVLAGTAVTSLPLNPLSSAIQGSIALGLSTAGSLAGARAFAHRPEGGSKKGGHQ